MNPPLDLAKLSANELHELIRLHAAADADDAIAAMLEGIRDQQRRARVALAAARNDPAKLEEARSSIQQAKEAAGWIEQHSDTWHQVHAVAFLRGALWMIQQQQAGPERQTK